MIPREKIMGRQSSVTSQANEYNQVLWAYDWCQEPSGMRIALL